MHHLCSSLYSPVSAFDALLFWQLHSSVSVPVRFGADVTAFQRHEGRFGISILYDNTDVVVVERSYLFTTIIMYARSILTKFQIAGSFIRRLFNDASETDDKHFAEIQKQDRYLLQIRFDTSAKNNSLVHVVLSKNKVRTWHFNNKTIQT